MKPVFLVLVISTTLATSAFGASEQRRNIRGWSQRMSAPSLNPKAASVAPVQIQEKKSEAAINAKIVEETKEKAAKATSQNE